MKAKRAQYLAENMDRLARRDRVLLNNPVIMQGMGLAPLVVAASSGVNAFILSVAVVLLLTPTRVVGAVVARFSPYRFRAIVYTVTAAVLYIGAYLLVRRWFEVEQVLNIGIYLPLLVVEPLVIKRYERPQKEAVPVALKKGLAITAGYVLVLMVIGCAREALAVGAVFGHTFTRIHLLPAAALPAGGFILVGLLCAVWRGAVNAYKKHVNMEAKRGV